MELVKIVSLRCVRRRRGVGGWAEGGGEGEVQQVGDSKS